MEKKIRTLATLSAPHFSVHLDRVRMVSGKMSERIRIDHPVASAILPLTEKNEILMVKQFRYALGEESLEIPAGKVDPGETPLECARRELIEETGFEAGSLEEIFQYYPAIGYSNEMIKIYLGTDIRKVSAQIDEDEITGVQTYSIDQVKDMIMNGQIRDSKTVLAVAVMQKMEW